MIRLGVEVEVVGHGGVVLATGDVTTACSSTSYRYTLQLLHTDARVMTMLL